MKWPILTALALICMPAAAQAQTQEKEFSETVGDWVVKGSAGGCHASIAVDDAALMVLSPAVSGENYGGIAIGKPGKPVPDGAGATLEFVDSGSFAGTHDLFGMSDAGAYWVAMPGPETVNSFSDSFRVRLKRDGQTLIDMQVNGFAAARTTLRRCIQAFK